MQKYYNAAQYGNRNTNGFGTDYWNKMNDTWEYDGAQWHRRATSASPPARYAHCMSYDLIRRRVVLVANADVDVRRRDLVASGKHKRAAERGCTEPRI